MKSPLFCAVELLSFSRLQSFTEDFTLLKQLVLVKTSKAEILHFQLVDL